MWLKKKTSRDLVGRFHVKWLEKKTFHETDTQKSLLLWRICDDLILVIDKGVLMGLIFGIHCMNEL